MLRLSVLSGARSGSRFEFATPIVRIGRAPDNDVALDPNVDLDASAYHAELRLEGGAWYLVDLGSRNGVYLPSLGMRRVQRHRLAPIEQVQIGPDGPRLQIEQLVLTEQGSALPALIEPIPPSTPPRSSPALPTEHGPDAAPPAMGRRTLLAHVNEMIGSRREESTKELQEIVDRNVAKATGRMRILVGVLLVAVLAAGAALVVIAIRKPDPAKLRDELDTATDDSVRHQKEKSLIAANPNSDDLGHAIYAKNREALFMLVAHHGRSYDHGGFCTAFAIKPRVLASNAHCVRAAEDFEDQGADIWAHLNESSKGGKPRMFKIGRHKKHPLYRHNAEQITPDVGLFTLEEEDAPTLVTVASDDELEKLGTGDALYVLGFPGRTMDEASPVAVFMFSHVGRITDEFGQRPDKFKDAWLVQHEGQTTPGTSGSPIFDSLGHVVAINAGGLLEQNKQAIYKYAMRIDLLRSIDLSTADSDDDDGVDPPPVSKKHKKKTVTDDDEP